MRRLLSDRIRTSVTEFPVVVTAAAADITCGCETRTHLGILRVNNASEKGDTSGSEGEMQKGRKRVNNDASAVAFAHSGIVREKKRRRGGEKKRKG